MGCRGIHGSLLSDGMREVMTWVRRDMRGVMTDLSSDKNVLRRDVMSFEEGGEGMKVEGWLT